MEPHSTVLASVVIIYQGERVFHDYISETESLGTDFLKGILRDRHNVENSMH